MPFRTECRRYRTLRSFCYETDVYLPATTQEIRQSFGFQGQLPRQAANRNLVVIAGVNHGHIIAVDQVIPILSRDLMPGACCWVDMGLAHGDNLTLQAHFHTRKRWGVRSCLLPLQTRTTGEGT